MLRCRSVRRIQCFQFYSLQMYYIYCSQLQRKSYKSNFQFMFFKVLKKFRIIESKSVFNQVKMNVVLFYFCQKKRLLSFIHIIENGEKNETMTFDNLDFN